MRQLQHVTGASRSSQAHMDTALDMTSARKPAASPDFRASNSLLCMRMAGGYQHGSTQLAWRARPRLSGDACDSSLFKLRLAYTDLLQHSTGWAGG